MKALRAALSKLEARLNAATLRERAIVLVAICATLLLVWYQLFAHPTWQRLHLQQAQTQSTQSQWEALNAQLGPLEKRLADDPNKVLKEQNRQLMIQIEQQERSLQERLERLVKPEEMPALLEKMLHENAGLSIVKIEKKPTILVQVGGNKTADTTAKPGQQAQAAPVAASATEAQTADPGTPLLYRHGLRMEFEGNFRDTLAYLKRLEGMEKAILFNSLEFKIEAYPKAKVILEVETLSLDKGWLGV